MNNPALAETADFYRVDASLKLDTGRRALLGQSMTPAPIGRFMASLFTETRGDMHVLDPGRTSRVRSSSSATRSTRCCPDIFATL